MMRLLGYLVLLAGALWATPTATLTGRVTDPAGAVMPDVEVQAINVETKLRLTTETNEEGLYSIPQLAPGTYRIVLRKHGFKMILKSGVELRVQDIIALNFEMQIGSVDQSITVEEGVPLLQAETATLGQTIDRNVMAELPTLTRNPYDFVALSAGVSPARNANGRGVTLAMNGQRAESANFLLDGSDNTNPSTSNPGQTVPHEAVREYRVLTNSFTAEYGRNSGFVANLVTKSGTNEFHGSLYDFVRNSRLAANSFENNARLNARAVFNRHQVGASLGGPIVRDKAFFFGSFESILVRSSDTRPFRVPTPQLLAITSPATQAIFGRYPLPLDLSTTEVVRQTVRPFGGGSLVTLPVFAATSRIGPVDAGAGAPQDTYLGTARVDYALGSRTMLMGRYAIQDADHFAAVSQPYTPELDQPLLWRNQNAALSLTRVWFTGVVSESRLVYSRLSTAKSPAGPDGWFGSFVIGGQGSQLPGAERGSAAVKNLYQANHAISWARNAHFVKFGGGIVHYRDASLFPGDTRANFATLQGFVDGQLNFVRLDYDFSSNGRWPGDPITTPILPPERTGHIRFNEVAFFAQDTWKATPRLTLTPGLRWEYFGAGRRSGHERSRYFNFYRGEGPTQATRLANGRFSLIGEAPEPYAGHTYLPDRNNFAPRLGIAYALTADGKTMLRAGAGLFYEAGYQRGGNHGVTQTSPVQISAVTLTPELLGNPYSVRGSASAVQGGPIYSLDQDLRSPYVPAWNTTVEREIRSAVVLAASYVGSSGSGLHGFVTHNQRGSGRYAGRPGERLLPNLAYLYFLQNFGHSSYHSLQLRAESRQIRALGLQFGTNYTWGRAIDNGSASETEGSGFTQGHSLSFTSPRLDRGDSSFDQRQRLVAHFIWQLPAHSSMRGFVRHVAAGWQVSGILSFQSGQPFNVVDLSVSDRGNSPFSTRPRVTGPLPQVFAKSEMIPDPTAQNRFLYLPANLIRRNTACIPNAAPFACLNSIDDRMDDVVPRSIYRRPGKHFQDVALSRNIRVHESVRVQIRAEFYNLFNHANLELANSGFDLGAPSFAGSTVAGVVALYGSTFPGFMPPRQVVVAAKVIF